jgi:hypothetical protein
VAGKIEADKIVIRWWDGFKRVYDITEYEPGCDYLWLKFPLGHEMWIPTRGVRWFSPVPMGGIVPD